MCALGREIFGLKEICEWDQENAVITKVTPIAFIPVLIVGKGYI
jgi:hypothetical protein